MRPAVLAAVMAFNPRHHRARRVLLAPTRQVARAVLGLLDHRRRRADAGLHPTDDDAVLK